jgi:hypothetical protein
MARAVSIQSLALASLPVLMLTLACDKKADIANTPPLAAKQPGEILAHLQYLAIKKDYKHLVIIAPVAADVVFPAAAWFHRQAASLGIKLNPEEMKSLGVESLADKLDALPPSDVPGYGIQEARACFNAGIYRLVKGFDDDVWANMVVMKTAPNAGNSRVTDVTIGNGRQALMTIGCIKRSDETYGVSNIQYNVGLRKK